MEERERGSEWRREGGAVNEGERGSEWRREGQ